MARHPTDCQHLAVVIGTNRPNVLPQPTFNIFRNQRLSVPYRSYKMDCHAQLILQHSSLPRPLLIALS